MKENSTLKVSIAGIAFVLERDAYNVMRDYLDKLMAGYARNPDGREIVADIEARIAELILDRQDGGQIVSTALVNDIISQLGFPDDMDDPDDDIPTDDFPRRLYRNSHGSVIAGICSGIGTYFRIDPVWVRLIFLAPLFLGIVNDVLPWRSGSDFWYSIFALFVTLYFVLWIAVPMARTPRQKLEMRGEKVTVSSIKDEMKTVGNTPEQRRSASVWAEVMYVIGRILLVMLRIVVIFSVVIMGIVAVAFVIAILALLFSGETFMNEYSIGALTNLSGIGPATLAILILFAMLIPLIVIVYILVRVAFGSRTNKSFLTVMGIIWLLLVAYIAAITAYNGETIKENIEQGDWFDFGERERIRHDARDWDEEQWREEWHGYSGDRPDNKSGDDKTDDSSSSGEWRMEEKSPSDERSRNDRGGE